MREIELVVFDMAGTTIEDGGQVLNAFTAALHNAGIVVSDIELQAWRGAAKREVLRFFLDFTSSVASWNRMSHASIMTSYATTFIQRNAARQK